MASLHINGVGQEVLLVYSRTDKSQNGRFTATAEADEYCSKTCKSLTVYMPLML